MFQPHNNPADALAQLWALQFNLGKNINEHITKFKMALAWTKLDKSDDFQATIVFFKETLPPWLIQWILGAKNIPETLRLVQESSFPGAELEGDLEDVWEDSPK